MPVDTQGILERRVAELAVNDPEFAAARPDEAVSAAIDPPLTSSPMLSLGKPNIRLNHPTTCRST